MTNARTASLITKDVKKTDLVPVGNQDMSIPVLRGGFMPQQTAVLMTSLTASAVRLRPRPDVRTIIP